MADDIQTYHDQAIHHEAQARYFRELERLAIERLPKPQPKPILRELAKKLINLKKHLV